MHWGPRRRRRGMSWLLHWADVATPGQCIAQSFHHRDQCACLNGVRLFNRCDRSSAIRAAPRLHATRAVVGPPRVEDAVVEGSMDRLAAIFQQEIDRLAGVRQKGRTENPFRLHDVAPRRRCARPARMAAASLRPFAGSLRGRVRAAQSSKSLNARMRVVPGAVCLPAYIAGVERHSAAQPLPNSCDS
jgi:hypothetical protein